jgi:hypothetical protein
MAQAPLYGASPGDYRLALAEQLRAATNPGSAPDWGQALAQVLGTAAGAYGQHAQQQNLQQSYADLAQTLGYEQPGAPTPAFSPYATPTTALPGAAPAAPAVQGMDWSKLLSLFGAGA